MATNDNYTMSDSQVLAIVFAGVLFCGLFFSLGSLVGSNSEEKDIIRACDNLKAFVVTPGFIDHVYECHKVTIDKLP